MSLATFFLQEAPKPNMLMTLLPFVLIFAVMYFIMVLPQKKERKKHENMLANLKPGDRVLMQSGIYGTVVKIQDNKITLRVADNVKMEFLLATVAAVVAPEEKAE